MKKIILPDENATSEFAKEFAQQLKLGEIIYLKGELGAGKTTFVRYVLRALGFEERVKSPTYTILENYPLKNLNVVHMDLYRMNDPHELEFLGLDEYFSDPKMVAFIEWPEKGEGILPAATLEIIFEIVREGRRVQLIK